MDSTIFFFDGEGDIVKGNRYPWQYAFQFMDNEDCLGEGNYLIREGLGEYPSRQKDQDKMIQEGLTIVSYQEAKEETHKLILPILQDRNVTIMPWGTRDFSKFGDGFFPEGVTFSNGIESWAESCPIDYSAPLTRNGNVAVTLKDVVNFEIGESFSWHDAMADVEALHTITKKTLDRGGNIVQYPDYMSFHRCPTQIVWNRMKQNG